MDGPLANPVQNEVIQNISILNIQAVLYIDSAQQLHSHPAYVVILYFNIAEKK